MKNLFLVTDGEYSDYRVVGVFSTREKAQKIAKLVGGEIEVYTLNERTDWIPRTVWETVIYVKDGQIDKDFTREHVGQELAPSNAKLRHIKHDFWSGYDILHVSSFISAEHSMKLAVEVRQKILRERATNPKYVHPDVNNEGVWFSSE